MSSPRIHLSRIMGIPQRKQGCFVRKEEMIAVWPKEQLSKANKNKNLKIRLVKQKSYVQSRPKIIRLSLFSG